MEQKVNFKKEALKLPAKNHLGFGLEKAFNRSQTVKGRQPEDNGHLLRILSFLAKIDVSF